MIDDLTTARVARIPNCDLCRDGTRAKYDSKTNMGPWAYVCEAHFALDTPGELGTGKGQRLILDA